MIDVHNFRFQSSDGGVSTSTTGSRSSEPSCLKPMTREYKFLFCCFFIFIFFFVFFVFFSFVFFFFCYLFVSRRTFVLFFLQLLYSFTTRSFVVLLFSTFAHIPHGPLFPVRDPLRRVSPGQVLETRGFHRKSILRSSFPIPFSFPSSLAGSSRLLAFPSPILSFVSCSSCRQSVTLPCLKERPSTR